MRAHESVAYGPVAATPAQFTLNGGKYWFSGVGSFAGATVALQRLTGDGEFLTVGSVASLTANGGGVVDLPPGTYQITFSGGAAGAAVWVEVIRIPEE